jgi:hypothetical protein
MPRKKPKPKLPTRKIYISDKIKDPAHRKALLNLYTVIR